MRALLNISNFALISELKVEFDRGLNLLTGETGSGKSIIVDALGVLIGDRFPAELVRGGAGHASVEGLFTPGAGRRGAARAARAFGRGARPRLRQQPPGDALFAEEPAAAARGHPRAGDA